MQGTVGIPHREVAVESPIATFDDFAIGEFWIGTIHITHLTGQEGAAIEGTIELIHVGLIRIFHIDGVQTVDPPLDELFRHTLEVMPFSLEGKVSFSTCPGRKRGGCLEDQRLVGLAIEGQPYAQAVASEIPDRVVALQEIVAVDASRFTPSLINTVNWVIAIDRLGDGVYFQVSLTLITIVIQHDVNRAVLLWGDAEDGCMAGGRHL